VVLARWQALILLFAPPKGPKSCFDTCGKASFYFWVLCRDAPETLAARRIMPVATASFLAEWVVSLASARYARTFVNTQLGRAPFMSQDSVLPGARMPDLCYCEHDKNKPSLHQAASHKKRILPSLHQKPLALARSMALYSPCACHFAVMLGSAGRSSASLFGGNRG